MKISKLVGFAAVCIALIATSCKKDKDIQTKSNDTSTPTEAGFYYGENGTSALIQAEDATANQQYKTIIARNNNTVVVEIVLTDLQPGTYSLAGTYAFTYVKNNQHWTSTSGSLTITKNENSKISGTYEATAGTGVSGVQSVKGKFIDIPVN